MRGCWSAGAVLPGECLHGVWKRVDHDERAPLDLLEGVRYRESCLLAQEQNPFVGWCVSADTPELKPRVQLQKRFPPAATGGFAFLGPDGPTHNGYGVVAAQGV